MTPCIHYGVMGNLNCIRQVNSLVVAENKSCRSMIVIYAYVVQLAEDRKQVLVLAILKVTDVTEKRRKELA